ncbi:winged helix-turn-helix transcriptional regulator [Ktedonobacter robiniae]|uniref:HxlR family transcriptional regulator n=1 Tax=Ktedonobacter robiniae TaxID=2778365 RepID=A0ABQ3UWZ5_9CHLR|nr:helix-turn-helix domain-containing protein [Ktedonobacter robiniae]GHO57183.1 HxlR family transcriptional regulator [Ktedonobacter robiniae]
MSACHNVCSRQYQQAAKLIGKRWVPLILKVLLSGSKHFTQIEEQIEGLSSRVLSERLKELEQERIIERRVFADIPVRIEYCLTEKGYALEEVITAIEHWSTNWLPS